MRYWSWPKWILEQCEFYISIRSLIVFLLNQHPPTSENTYKIDQFLKSPHQQWTCINTHVPLGKEFPYEWNRNRDRSISLAPPLHFISASLHPTWANLNILITSINNPQNDDDFYTNFFCSRFFLSTNQPFFKDVSPLYHCHLSSKRCVKKSTSRFVFRIISLPR